MSEPKMVFVVQAYDQNPYSSRGGGWINAYEGANAHRGVFEGKTSAIQAAMRLASRGGRIRVVAQIQNPTVWETAR
jgi:Uncharacterized protein conserved in bacteria (DUF2188)